MQAPVSGEHVLDSQLATRLSGPAQPARRYSPDLSGLTRRGLEITTLAAPVWAPPRSAALFRAKEAVRDNVTAPLAKTSLATPLDVYGARRDYLHPGMGATPAEQVSRYVAGRQRDEAKRTASPAGRRAHQQPDRPPAGHLRGNRAQPPGKHLRTAEGLQPHRRSHPRPRRPVA
jgi:hypothetical protein